MSEEYPRPPITEAIIEIRIAEPLADSAVQEASRHFASLYPHEEIVRNLGVQLGVPDAPHGQFQTRVDQQLGVRRSSTDQTELLLLWPGAFVISQLAPYPGWPIFFGRFMRDWKLWKKEVGYRKTNRVGVRFVNRIDVPLTGPVMEESEYLYVYPRLPSTLEPVFSYAIQAQIPISDMACSLTLNSALVPSPILNHSAILLDIDIAMEVNTPQNDDGIYELLNKIRDKKNSVFEECVTDRARELFRK